MTFPTYSTGTVSVLDNGTVVTGLGTLWQRSNARQGDKIIVDPAAGHPEITILAVNDLDQVTLAQPWTHGDKTSVAYIIIKNSVERVSGVRAFDDLDSMIAAMNSDGFYHFVASTQTLPDDSYGDDGQYAFQASTGKLWVKETVWQFVGVYKGFGLPAPWSSVKAYVAFDVATLNGTSYVAIAPSTNQAPPNATYWTVLASKGDTGNVGPTGPGYGGASSTALTIGTGSRVFTTQTGMAYQVGTRVRAASAANPSNYMEGIVTAYSGTFLTVNMSRTNGAGTFSDWMLSVAGDPGAGDMLSTNNLSEVNPAISRTNLGLGSGNSPQFIGIELGHATDTTVSRPAAGRMQVEGEEVLTTKSLSSILTDAQKQQLRANLGVSQKNYIMNGGFLVSQEYPVSAQTVSGRYPADQWIVTHSTTGAVSYGQVNSYSIASGTPYRLSVSVTTADASIGSGEFLIISQPIEGYRVQDLGWGVASVAKSITLKFGVNAPAGTYCVSIRNRVTDRSYVAEYTISGGEAGSDVYKSIAVPGDVTGSWDKNNVAGMIVSWNLVAGSSFQGAAGAWTAGNIIGTSNQVNFLGTIGNTFYLFDVGMYRGNAAPDFVAENYVDTLRECQRYYEKADFASFYFPVGATGTQYNNVNFTEKRANPTMAFLTTLQAWTTGGGNATPTSQSLVATNTKNAQLSVSISGNIGGVQAFTYSANSRML